MLQQLSYVTRRLLRRTLPLTDAAARSWVIHPAQRTRRSRAFFLDGQLDRVEGVQEETTRENEERRVLGSAVEHAATRGHELRDAVLVGGSVYAGGSRLALLPGSAVPETFQRPREELATAALDCTFVGNRYFGHWITDDCPLHLLARDHAPPIGVVRAPYAQEEGYCALWGLSPRKVPGARVRSLLVFQDYGQNAHKRGRYTALRTALAARVGPRRRRGVYLRRGTTGVRRLLENEQEIEARLAGRGFDVVDPVGGSAEDVARACVGAACVVGVEGSGLAHGVVAVADGGAIVALQPPWRFNNVFKDYADCLDLRYGFVVGTRAGDGFRVDPGELERTLDLCDRA
ncbi:glycosyltransferase 61 family protein [Anaeromyxobacter oryzae]|uniref:Glycosyltransferase 61 catalytic domain-containing protein n=1 Tax=Anaeromyxobacter oryzae TaxID=2918170 RepID=A0ABN6MUJ1_9BACT|nr:glycosyltransferase family 61 protein [Anaeromyxobacter oryzae]BDG04647.1 hypothetical protein AMOR_36430 [Anaeromyxobacter oryzae]